MRKLTDERIIKYKELGILKIFESINEYKADEVKEIWFLELGEVRNIWLYISSDWK